MDLKTYLFVNGITNRQFAAMMGLNATIAQKIISRASRPSGERAALISEATNGHVTVDELVNPQNYPVYWKGDKSKKTYMRKVNPRQPSEEKLASVRSLRPATKAKRVRNGQANKKDREEYQKDNQTAQESGAHGQETRPSV